MDLNCTRLFLQNIGSVKLLDRDEEVELFNRAKTGDLKARDAIVLANLRLVVSIAKTYPELELDDAIQSGTEGIFKAIDKFDPNRDARFATYAKNYVHKNIRCFIHDKTKPIHFTSYVQEVMSELNEVEKNLRSVQDSTPSVELLMKETKYSEIQILNAQRARAMSVSSLDAFADEEGHPFDVEDPQGVNPQDTAIQRSLRDEIRRLISHSALTERETDMILYAYGFYDGKAKKNPQLSQIFGISAERCRQIKNEALRKLRSNSRGLEVFLEEN